MDKERLLYDKFIETLIGTLDSGCYDSKILNVIMNFLKNNDIQASEANEGLSDLCSRFKDLPFEDDMGEVKEAPIRFTDDTDTYT